MAGRFEIYKDATDRFRFRFVDSGGTLLAVGEAFESRAAALNAVALVIAEGGGAEIEDQT